MPHLLTLPGFKSKSGESTSLTAKNLERHKREFLARENRDLRTFLAARDAENKAQAAEIEELRQRLATVSAANGTDETKTPVSNVQEPPSDKTPEVGRNYSTWRFTTNSDCV